MCRMSKMEKILMVSKKIAQVEVFVIPLVYITSAFVQGTACYNQEYQLFNRVLDIVIVHSLVWPALHFFRFFVIPGKYLAPYYSMAIFLWAIYYSYEFHKERCDDCCEANIY